jgi:23S rRNA (uracil-5-)-methyltransferase RumA
VQLTAKQARLERALAHFDHLPSPVPIVGSQWTAGYRHRLKLPVRITRSHVAIGLYDPTDGSVLDTPDCPVLAEELRAFLPTLTDWLRGRRGVHSVDLRVSRATGELQLVLACKGSELDGGPRAARALVRDVPALASVAVSRADPKGRRVMGAAPRVIAGSQALEERIDGVAYDVLPGAFFQVDPRQAAVLHGLVKKAVGGARTVLDLYAGVGAYALSLAEGRDRVVAVEEVPTAAQAAARRAPKNVTVVEGRVEDTANHPALAGPFDCVVLNPARRGSDPDSLARVAKLAKRAVYVSCGPETLARDLDILSAHGLRVTRITPIDLFPQTREVEAVVQLDRGAARVHWAGPDGGRVGTPWRGKPSGALGRPDEVLALLLGRVRPGRFGPADVEVLAEVATHSLCRLTLKGPLDKALGVLAQRGHGVAGQDRKTALFFADKAGLVRPFLHVSRAGKTRAPLHGDLRLALEALGHRRGRPVKKPGRSGSKRGRGKARGGKPRGGRKKRW